MVEILLSRWQIFQRLRTKTALFVSPTTTTINLVEKTKLRIAPLNALELIGQSLFLHQTPREQSVIKNLVWP